MNHSGERTVQFACLITLSALLTSAFAAPSQKLKFEHLTVTQGLSNNIVSSIIIGHDGYLWIGTEDGLCRYDGYDFHTYRSDVENEGSLGNNTVSALYEDRTGGLWVGTHAGLNRLDRITGGFQRLFCDPHDTLRFISDYVSAICEDGAGVLWIGTEKTGLRGFERNSGKFRRVTATEKGLSDNRVRAMICDHAGVLWIGTRDGCLNRFDPTKNQFTRTMIRSPKTLTAGDNGVKSLVEDHLGMLWIGTYDFGLIRFDPATGEFESFVHESRNAKSLSNNSVNQVIMDQSGALWVGTNGGGLDTWDPKTRSFVHHVSDPKDQTRLTNDIVFALCEDRSGVVWIGTVAGLNKLDPKRSRFKNFSHDPDDPKSLSSNHVGPINEDRSGQLWISTHGGGLNRLDRAHGVFEHFIFDPGNPRSIGSNDVASFYEDRLGTFWVGTWGGGLNRFNPQRGEFKRFTSDQGNPKTISSNYITPIYEDLNGILWVGTLADGLNKFDPKTGECTRFRHVPGNANTLSNNTIWEFETDSSGAEELLWIATNHGLTRFNVTQEKFQQFFPDTHPRSSGNSVQAIHRDYSGAIWLGTFGGGLYRFEPTTSTFTRFTVKDGLPNEMIWGILEDDRGDLWISTSNGISRFNPKTGRFKNFDVGDGLQGNEFNGGSHCRLRNGELCFGGTDGFTVFHPDSIRDNPYSPPIVIAGFKKFDKPVLLDSAISEKRLIELSYRENVFSFEFAALDYTDPERNHYAYKLEGFDNDWTYCGKRRYATYTNLDAGSYIFRVKGSNNDGVWNEKGTSIAVVITPPLWGTWWFRTLAALTILISVGGTIRYVEIRKLRRRIEQLELEKALERERARISQDMHDEVGASLTEIAILSELAKKEIGGGANPAGLHIGKIADRSREVVDSISEIIWTINPKNDHLNDLVAYLHHFTVQFLKATAMRCQFESPDRIPDISLSAEGRRNIFLVVKEALHNVVKHSSATQVTVTCGFADGWMEVSVEDNGKGFSLDRIHRLGNGLSNMSKRIENIGGTFALDSRPGGGTTVRIGVPIG